MKVEIDPIIVSPDERRSIDISPNHNKGHVAKPKTILPLFLTYRRERGGEHDVRTDQSPRYVIQDGRLLFDRICTQDIIKFESNSSQQVIALSSKWSSLPLCLKSFVNRSSRFKFNKK